VLIAGGSGITPLMAIARTLLATEPDAQLALVYANRRRASILFEAALDALRREHPGRLSVRHVLEEAPPGWDGERGRLDRATCARALSALPLAGHPSARYFVCGPDGMRDEVLVALADRGVAPGAVLVERFATGPRPLAAGSGAGLPAALDAASSGGRSVAIRVGERTHQALARPGATLLEAGLAAGVSMPFSCAVGGCGACRVRLVEGQVELDEPNCLSASERGLGYVLACVGRPLGTCVVEVPEVS
jgi:ferredoxin-NADP reductase